MLAGPPADFLDGKGGRAGKWHPELPLSGPAVGFVVAIFTGLYALYRLERVPAPARHARRDISRDIFAEAYAATASAGFFIPRALTLLPGKRRK